MPQIAACPAPGDAIVARGRKWIVVDTASYGECQAVRLRVPGASGIRTLLLPFDRIARPASPRLSCCSARAWHRAFDALRRTDAPFGALTHWPGQLQVHPYQLEPALAMLRHGWLRLLVADDVGLGKTIEAGVVLNELSAASGEFRGLVLTPAGLKAQWRAELTKHFALHAEDADAAWLRHASRELPPHVNPWSPPGIYIASFDFIKRPEALRPLEDVRWDLLVVDEAHAVSGGSDRRVAVHAIAQRARRVMLLTATPHAGDEHAFASLCGIGELPGSPLACVQRSRADVWPAPRRKTTILYIRPRRAEEAMHQVLDGYTSRLWRTADTHHPRARLVAIVLRKRALSCAASLLVSIERRIALLQGEPPQDVQLALPLEGDESPEDAASDAILGAPGFADPREEIVWLERVAAAARRAARADSKLRALARFARRLREPAIVFTEYRDTLDRLHLLLATHGTRTTMLHGGMTGGERQGALSRFLERGGILLATDAAAEGLNLQHCCRTVLHFELPWMPGRLTQRAGRVDRIGQSRRAHEILFVAAHTCEALVLAPLVRRLTLLSGHIAQPLLERLTESQVAARILEGIPWDLDVAADRARPSAIDLREEAAVEAERIRASLGITPSHPRDRIPIAVLRRPARHLARGLLLLMELRTATESGTVVDSILAPVHVRTRLPAAISRATARAIVKVYVPVVRDVLRQQCEARLAFVRPRYESVRGALVTRDAEMDRSLRSGARELVQAGLFDRRALRAAQREREAAQALLNDSTQQRQREDGGRLQCEAVLRAALVVPRSVRTET